MILTDNTIPIITFSQLYKQCHISKYTVTAILTNIKLKHTILNGTGHYLNDLEISHICFYFLNKHKWCELLLGFMYIPFMKSL